MQNGEFLPGAQSASRMKFWENASFPRIIPFALFMAWIGLEEIIRYLGQLAGFAFKEQWSLLLYPLRAFTAGLALVLLWSRYSELRLRDFSKYSQTLLSAAVGVLVFLLWVNLDFTFGFQSEAPGYNPSEIRNQAVRWAMTFTRFMGATLIVPVMEEIFWRSFLIRYIIRSDFESVPVGAFTWPSFLISALLFGLEHHLIIAGVVAGVLYNILLYKTKSIAQCVLSHAVTNAILGIYILYTGQWRFW